MVVLGGMGNIYGVILGAIILQGLNFYLLPQINEWVHAIGNAVGSPLLSQADIPKYNFFLFGVILVLMMLLQARGHHPQPPARRGVAQRRRRRRRRRAWGERP